MTKQELKKAIKLAVKNGMGEKIRTIHVDLDSATDSVITVVVVYGKFGVNAVTFSLQRLARNDGYYSVYYVDGKANVYHIKGINEELKAVI